MASVDIDIIANPASMAASLQRMQKAKDDIAKGVTGGVARWDTEFNNLSKSLVSATNRSEQAALRMAKSYAQASQFASLSGEDKILARSAAVKAALTDRVSNTTKLAKALADVDSATKKLVETERASQSKGGGILGGFGLGTGTPGGMAIRSVRDIIEGRTGYGMVTGVSAIGGLGGVTAAVGGLTLGLTALSVSGYKAAESLASTGVAIREVQARTGFTVAEVNQFGFAAAATGQTIDVFERAMRGLSTAVEDQTSAGEKGRMWLKQFGVDVRGVREGTVSAAEIIQQLTNGLGQLPNVFERNKAGMDIFKRAWIEMAPAVLEASQNIAIAKAAGFGPSEADVTKYMKLNAQILIYKSYWEDLKRSFKEGLVIDVKFIGNAAKFLLEGVSALGIGGGVQGGGTEGDFVDKETRRKMNLEEDIRQANKMRGRFGPYQPATEIGRLQLYRMRELSYLDPKDAWKSVVTGMSGTHLALADVAQSKMEAIRAGTDAASAQAKAAVQAQVDAELKAYERGEGGQGKLRQLEKQLSGMERPSSLSAPGYAQQYAGIERQIAAQKELNKQVDKEKSILEDVRKARIDIADQLAHPYGRTSAEKSWMAFQEKLPTTLTPAEYRAAEERRGMAEQALRQEQTAQLAKLGLAPTGLFPAFGALGIPRMAGAEAFRRTAETPITLKGEEKWGLETAAGKEMTERLKQDDAENRESIRALESIWTQSRKYTSETAEAGVKFRSTLAPDTIENRLSAESQLVAIKKNASDDEARQSLAKIRGEWETLSSYRSLTHEEALMYTNEETAVRLKNEDEVAKARDQYAQQWAGEIRKQLDEIKGTAESLFHTLFTSPSKFGSQLGTTLKNAALKPIESGLASTVSYALHPLIFGGSGTGGIAGSLRGMFGGGRVGPIGTAVDPVHVIPVGGGGTTVFGGFGMGGGQTGAVGRPGMSGAPGITFGMPGYSGSGGGGVGYMPSFSGIGMFGPMARGGGYQPSAGGDWTGAGGTGGSGSYGGGRGTSDGGGGGGGFGGGAGFGGMTGMLKGLRGQWGIGGHSVIDANGFATGDSTTTFGSVMNSQGMKASAGAAGMMLAQQGLLGSSRGTWGGVAEGTVGGAGVGFMMGGPLGAAIGAAAGLGIGIGEKIAGVETPQNEAKRLVKSQYGISINNSMANSIVQLARSKYGNTVSIAVRSPEVRQMLGLYAAGTGQRMAQSADMPHGAGLVESGGRLAQEQMYQYGVGHTYSSNLPVEGGGSGSQFPSGGTGNVAMSFNIQGSDISRFMSGNVFTPGATASNYAASLAASNGRTDAAMAFQEPGSIVA